VYTLTLGPVSDPGDDVVTQYLVNWGDGASDTLLSPGDVNHIYSDGDKTHIIFVDLVDEDGLHQNAGQKPIDVNNVAPTVSEISAPIDPTQVNTQITATATFPDPGVLDTHTATFD